MKIVAKKDEKGAWTNEARVVVAEQIYIHGNIRKVSTLTGVPYDTILDWQKSDWWPELISEIRRVQSQELQSKLGAVAGKALEIVEDRMENGEIVLNNKTGEMVRKPVGIRDAGRIATDLITKRIQLEHQTQEEIVHKETIQESLKLLAAAFAKFNKQYNNKDAETIEFKEHYAIHDKREEGLQEGGPTIHESSGGSQKTSGAE